jgi:hypothetical protein
MNLNKRRPDIAEVLALFALMVIGLSRIVVASAARFNHDEVRSISRSLGSFAQISMWQPPDWPPLYYWFLSLWQASVGIQPFFLRYSGVLIFILGAALIYQCGRSLFRDQWTGLAVMLVYAGLGMNVFLSVHLRGYALMLLLYPLALWATIQYLDRGRLWVGGGVLAVALAAMFYTTYTSVLAYIPLVLFGLVLRPRRWWWWFPPGLLALLLAWPQILDYVRSSFSSSSQAASWTASWFALPDLSWTEVRSFIIGRFESFTGPGALLWAGVGLLSVGTVLLVRGVPLRVRLFLLAWVVGSLLFAASFGVSYGMLPAQWWWYLTLWQALFIGLGVTMLPIWGRSPIFVVVGLLMFVPISQEQFFFLGKQHFPFEDVFADLSRAYQPGDVLFIDPNCPIYVPYAEGTCGSPEEWDYYQMVYFPDGRLRVVNDATGHRRIWYFHDINNANPDSRAQVAQGRLPSTFIGPREFHVQLYEAPPIAQGLAYVNGMRFHGVDVIDPLLGGALNEGFVTRREGETLELRLWWSLEEAVDLDYSVSIQIALNPDAPSLVQWDGSPTLTHLQPNLSDPLPTVTSAWEPGQPYVQTLVLDIPNVVPFDYMITDSQIYITVYQSWDGEVIPVEGGEDNGRLPIRNIRFLTY